jgi:toxin ParE1/3/4
VISLRWLPAAADDLEGIAEYLRTEAPESEAEIIFELHRGIKSLRAAPRLGRPTGTAGIRQLVFPRLRYLVTYRLTEDTIQILRIRHASRKPLRY